MARIIIPIICHFTILGQQNVQNMLQKYIVKQDQIYEQKNKGTKWWTVWSQLCFSPFLGLNLKAKKLLSAWNFFGSHQKHFNGHIWSTLSFHRIYFKNWKPKCLKMKWHWQGIINTLSNGLTYDMCRHFVKTSNKVDLWTPKSISNKYFLQTLTCSNFFFKNSH